ncbi:hypothetical protein B0H10DRAFT_2221347 [Mycena sp. CBHHK59/15]|nr:hypothetical protein B0H10DRAFT_2221347 [Mycena sp. CBHHK59/15]
MPWTCTISRSAAWLEIGVTEPVDLAALKFAKRAKIIRSMTSKAKGLLESQDITDGGDDCSAVKITLWVILFVHRDTRFEIDLSNKPEWYAPKINPTSKVPAIAYGGLQVPPDQPSPNSDN